MVNCKQSYIRKITIQVKGSNKSLFDTPLAKPLNLQSKENKRIVYRNTEGKRSPWCTCVSLLLNIAMFTVLIPEHSCVENTYGLLKKKHLKK